MLDEPFAGIDPKTVAEIQDQIRDLVETYNIGILLTDHQFRETLEVTDRCYLIREGRVFAYGNREQILNNPDVRRHYIGERFDVGHLLERRRPVSLSHHHFRRPIRTLPSPRSPISAPVSVSIPPSGPSPFTSPAAGFRDRGIRRQGDIGRFRFFHDHWAGPGRYGSELRPIHDRHQRRRSAPRPPAARRARAGGV